MRQFRFPRPMILISSLAITAGVLALGACGATTTIEQEWTTPTTQARIPLERVVTVFVSDNVTMRRSAEDQLARDLAMRGVQATPSYAILGEKELENTNAARAKLRQLGYDGVVVMRIVDREQELEYIPPTFDGYWGYWGWYPGYTVGWGGYPYTETIYRLETAAYSLRNNQLVWSALTRTVDPENARTLIDDTTQVVASELTERGLAG